jgi:hypothetical protein
MSNFRALQFATLLLLVVGFTCRVQAQQDSSKCPSIDANREWLLTIRYYTSSRSSISAESNESIANAVANVLCTILCDSRKCDLLPHTVEETELAAFRYYIYLRLPEPSPSTQAIIKQELADRLRQFSKSQKRRIHWDIRLAAMKQVQGTTSN